MGSKIAALIFFIVGLGFCAGAYLAVHNNKAPTSFVTTTGKVKRADYIGRGKNYSSVVTFKANNNQTYDFYAEIPGTPSVIAGQSVKVAYNPRNPAVGAKDISTATSVYAIIGGIIGGIFALLGLVSLVQQLIVG